MRELAAWSVWNQRAHLVADSYVGAVQRSGALAVLLAVDERAPARLLELIDALLLIGGADVDPATYGAERAPETEATYPERDAFEIALLHGALARGLPVLGICRGMQLINVALGGTLRQEIATPGGAGPHRRVLGSFEGTEQTIVLEPGSLALRATGEREHAVHCHHHQAIDELGEGLVVSGRAALDGLPEAIEATDGRWLLGVQWHPEAEPTSPVLTALASAASEQRERRSAAPNYTKGPALTPRPKRGIQSTAPVGAGERYRMRETG